MRANPSSYKLLILCILIMGGLLLGQQGVDVRQFIENPQEEDMSPYLQKAVNQAKLKGLPLIITGGRTYRLKKTIRIDGVKEILGYGQPVLQMQAPEQDILYSNYIWRIRIEGITFKGGRDQIAIGNKNIDRGHMVISNCRFVEANGVAVRFLPDTISTLCIVEKCVFDYCQQALVIVSDHSHFSDSWITTAPRNPRNLAVIENHNNLSCTNILGVPLVNDSDLRWIDNRGWILACKNFRFGGEGGGFTPVVNYKTYRPEAWGAQILLEDCWLGNQGNSTKKAAIYCYELPNSIVIRNSMLTGIPPVILDPKINLKTYFNKANPGMIRLDVANNTGEFVNDLPKGLIKAIADVQKGLNKSKDHILSDSLTRQAIKKAVAKARELPSAPQPQIKRKNKQIIHRQQTAPANYQPITMKSHVWTLDDCLDGMKQPCSEQLAIGDAGQSTVIMARMDKPTWPHVRIQNVTADLAQFPFLCFQLKDAGFPGGHIAVKIVDKATNRTTMIMEDYQKTLFNYQACDLRKAYGKRQGKVTFDIKFYLCGDRITNQGAIGKHGFMFLKQKEFFVLDFLRLERP